MFSEGESVTRDDADILCAFHDSWVAELDHPGINYWLKNELLKMTEPGEFNQFWLGAKTEVSLLKFRETSSDCKF